MASVYCHCKYCQKFNSAPLTRVVIFTRDNVKITEGEGKTVITNLTEVNKSSIGTDKRKTIAIHAANASFVCGWIHTLAFSASIPETLLTIQTFLQASTQHFM